MGIVPCCSAICSASIPHSRRDGGVAANAAARLFAAGNHGRPAFCEDAGKTVADKGGVTVADVSEMTCISSRSETHSRGFRGKGMTKTRLYAKTELLPDRAMATRARSPRRQERLARKFHTLSERGRAVFLIHRRAIKGRAALHIILKKPLCPRGIWNFYRCALQLPRCTWILPRIWKSSLSCPLLFFCAEILLRSPQRLRTFFRIDKRPFLICPFRIGIRLPCRDRTCPILALPRLFCAQL